MCTILLLMVRFFNFNAFLVDSTKQAEDRQLAALLASRVATFVLLALVSTHTAELVLIICDQRSIVSTAQSIIITSSILNAFFTVTVLQSTKLSTHKSISGCT